MEPEDAGVYRDPVRLDEALQPPEYVQHPLSSAQSPTPHLSGRNSFYGFYAVFFLQFLWPCWFFPVHFCPFLSSRRKEGTLSAVKQQCRPCRGDLVRILRVATTSEHLQHVPSSLTEASFCSAHPPPSLVWSCGNKCSRQTFIWRISSGFNQQLCAPPAPPIELETKVIWRVLKISQSRRRPLLGPTPGWKRWLLLSHIRHYAKQALTPR